MPNITKPSDINNIWAATGDIAAPDTAYVANGWEAIIPPREYFNWLDNKQDRFNAHVNQHGIPVWDNTTEYQAGISYTKGNDGLIYRATNTNSNVNPVGDTTGAWFSISDTGMIVLTASGTFNVPAILSSGFKKAKITVTGAGGGGGLGTAPITRAAGGGAGGTGIAVIDLKGIASVNVTIGQSLAGANGTSSSFGTYIVAAGGGAGADTTQGSGGLGGGVSGSASALALKGGTGSDAQNNGLGGSGDGGGSYWGGGTRSGTLSGTSAAIPVYGAGGGGVPLAPRSRGGAGVIVIEW